MSRHRGPFACKAALQMWLNLVRRNKNPGAVGSPGLPGSSPPPRSFAFEANIGGCQADVPQHAIIELRQIPPLSPACEPQCHSTLRPRRGVRLRLASPAIQRVVQHETDGKALMVVANRAGQAK